MSEENSEEFMIEARGLSKYYGDFIAVEDLNFSIRKGEVVHQENALACVKHAVQVAEDQAGVIINQAFMLFSSGNVQCLVNRGSVPVMNERQEIGREEIEDVMNNARAVSLPADREVVHSIPQHFYVDDQPGVIEPMGMDGAKLASTCWWCMGCATASATP